MPKPQRVLTYEEYLLDQGTPEELEYYEFLVVSNFLIHTQYDGTGPEYRDAAAMLFDWAQRLPQDTEAQQLKRRQELAMAKAFNSQMAIMTVVTWLLKRSASEVKQQLKEEKARTPKEPSGA